MIRGHLTSLIMSRCDTAFTFAGFTADLIGSTSLHCYLVACAADLQHGKESLNEILSLPEDEVYKAIDEIGRQAVSNAFQETMMHYKLIDFSNELVLRKVLHNQLEADIRQHFNNQLGNYYRKNRPRLADSRQ